MGYSLVPNLFELGAGKGVELAKQAGIDLELKVAPIITQKSNFKVNGFAFNVNGQTSQADFDPNLNDGETYSSLSFKIPTNLAAGSIFNFTPQVKPIADVSTQFGIAVGLNYNVSVAPKLPLVGKYSVFGVSNSLTSPSFDFSPINIANVFQSYQTIPQLSIQIV